MKRQDLRNIVRKANKDERVLDRRRTRLSREIDQLDDEHRSLRRKIMLYGDLFSNLEYSALSEEKIRLFNMHSDLPKFNGRYSHGLKQIDYDDLFRNRQKVDLRNDHRAVMEYFAKTKQDPLCLALIDHIRRLENSRESKYWPEVVSWYTDIPERMLKRTISEVEYNSYLSGELPVFIVDGSERIYKEIHRLGRPIEIFVKDYTGSPRKDPVWVPYKKSKN